MSNPAAKIRIENVLQPGKTYSADAAKYEAMKKAVLAVLPNAAPGLTVAEVQGRVLAHLPPDLYPGGAKSGWWMKTLQLDLEAKKIIRRERLLRSGPTRAELVLRRPSAGKGVACPQAPTLLHCRRKSPRVAAVQA
jgi:hypothetical protein